MKDHICFAPSGVELPQLGGRSLLQYSYGAFLPTPSVPSGLAATQETSTDVAVLARRQSSYQRLKVTKEEASDGLGCKSLFLDTWFQYC